MARLRTVYRCSDCGGTTPKWAGRCPACGAWNALVEDVEEVGGPAAPALLPPGGTPPVPVTEVDATAGRPVPTGVAELDRVLDGGLVPGSVTLVAGEPGIGKSTLLLDVAGERARGGAPVLYVSAEESTQQVRARAERIGALHPSLWLLGETLLPRILTALDDVRPGLVVVDSIQTVADPELPSAPGSVVQVRACAHRLVQEAKQRGIPLMIVGHVTKDGTVAGPRTLEHLVDTVLWFEGDRHHALRLLRAVKHRFGTTSELGVFEMSGEGLAAVPDASGLFLADRTEGLPGSVVVATADGQRPLLVEVQALTTPTTIPSPRRSAQGIDPGRLALLLAVLENRVGLGASQHDVFVSVVGGARFTEPGTDLGVCLAVVSALLDRPVPAGLVVVGEVGLGGELRQVARTARRLSEAARLGFTEAVVPASAPADTTGLRVRRVRTVADACAAVGLVAPLRELRDARARRDHVG